MRIWLRVLIAVVLLCQIGAAPNVAAYENVSLADLLAHPTSHDGRRVRVHGFLILEFEGDSLWSSETDFRAHRYERSVWINADFPHPDAEALSGKLAFVSGVFDADHGGHLGLWHGAIVDVSSMTVDPADTASPRPWRDDPLFVILASLGLLALFFAMVDLVSRTRNSMQGL